MMSHKPISRDELLGIFSSLDDHLARKGKTLSVTVIGGVSIILMGIRDRSTLDIDIANIGDAVEFQKLCEDQNIRVDIVTISSTVDFEHSPKIQLFKGRGLVVETITAEELVKLKLERFRKQDPEDIYAIIERTSLSYEHYKALVKDMLQYFIGNERELILSALIVVEKIYPDKKDDFASSFSFKI